MQPHYKAPQSYQCMQNIEKLGIGPENRLHNYYNKTTLVGCFQYLAVFSHEYIEDYFVESCTEFGVLVWDVGEDHLSEAKEILIVY